MQYIELNAKSAMHKLKRKIPYGWDLNIYRGCEHGCKYCFAMYSHDYLEDGNYFDTVYYKKEILTYLEKELSSPSWKREVVNIGGVTDSYQPIEKDLEIMRGVLKLMIQYKTPIIISTKSDLILRDLDLLGELSKITYVNVAFTITTVDEDLRKHLEPTGSPSLDRFKALKECKKNNVNTGIHIMPVIPYLTDNRKNLETIYAYASRIGVDYVLPGTLYLKGKTKPYFMNFIKEYNPDIYEKINILYKKGGAGKEYKDGLYAYINMLKGKYHVSSNYMKTIKEKVTQMSLL